MNTPNKITILRILLIPVFMIIMYADFEYSDVIALIIYILASATDAIDGHIARKNNLVTNLGKFLDPLADKLLVTAALLIFVERGQASSWAVMIIIVREFAVTGLRLVAAAEGDVIAAGMSGKIKTVVSLFGICFMLTPIHSFIILGVTVDNIIMALMVITTVWSGLDYFRGGYRILLNSK